MSLGVLRERAQGNCMMWLEIASVDVAKLEVA
jgi:hypothetical protein